MSRTLMLSFFAVCIVLALALFGYVHRGEVAVLAPHGPVSLAERSVILLTLLLCAVVVAPVFAMLYTFAWKYRADGPETKRSHDPDWDHESVLAEVVWWLVPSAIILVLAMLAWQSSHALDPYKPLEADAQPLTVEVVALDWKWLFIYPAQGIATVNLLEFPANTPVTLVMTADAPMNSLWIPSLAGQLMVMPGMSTQLNLLANATGTYQGYSANISGQGFAGMAFSAKAVTPKEFGAWVSSVNTAHRVLDAATYASLAAPSTYNPVTYYSSVEGDIYNSIMMKYMRPSADLQSTTTMP